MKILIIAGARPNFIKVAPILKQLSKLPPGVKISWKLVHTGQHYDDQMSASFFRELNIPAPDINLCVGSDSHAAQTAKIMTVFEQTCLAEKPDWIFVFGDVNSTLACALVAAKIGIKIAHIEAGLRSFDKSMPEEINRIVTDALSDVLFTPSVDANENLVKEGKELNKIKLVGNIMIDTLVEQINQIDKCEIHARLRLQKEGYVYVTLHRPSNVDDKATLSKIMSSLVELARKLPVVFPVHPRTSKNLKALAGNFVGTEVRLLDPIGYLDSLALTKNARLVITDSGGLQEETTYFRVPCLTLRPNTERPITINEGSNCLTSLATLAGDITDTLSKPVRFGQIPSLWDGQTSNRIIEYYLKS